VNVDVLFAPETDGDAPEGMLTIGSNDKKAPDNQIRLRGVGKLRNVDMAPGSINVGDTFAGIPVVLSSSNPGDILTVVNQDQEKFDIRAITVEGGDASAFRLTNIGGTEFVSVPIAANASMTFDVVFAPEVPGDFESTVVLYLDTDKTYQKAIPIRGRAIYANAYGGGGCSAGNGSGGLVVICVAGLFVVRRRRR
jgi:hypothetical protein